MTAADASSPSNDPVAQPDDPTPDDSAPGDENGCRCRCRSCRCSRGSGRSGCRCSRRAGRALLLSTGVIAASWLVARKRGYKLGPNTVVRCRAGHLFTTVWIPGVKLKAIDLGFARIQRCPVGHHWTLVRPVRDAELTDEERASAAAHHDNRIP